MPYCRECGAELGEDAKFCPVCGAPVTPPRVEYGRVEVSRRRWTVGRILALIFGGLILLTGFGLLVGGGALLWVNTDLTDNEGFITTKGHRLERGSYAIVFQHVNIQMGEVVGERGVWKPSPSDFVTIKLTGSSNDPSKNVFIGIAEESDAEAYLSGVQYDEVTRLRVSSSGSLDVEYKTHSGDTVPSDPASQTFWTVSEHGAGTQTLEWAPETGSYWIVMMNEDGSAGVDLTVNFGARVPMLSTIGRALFAGGVIATIMGGVIVYLGVHR